MIFEISSCRNKFREASKHIGVLFQQLTQTVYLRNRNIYFKGKDEQPLLHPTQTLWTASSNWMDKAFKASEMDCSSCVAPFLSCVSALAEELDAILNKAQSSGVPVHLLF